MPNWQRLPPLPPRSFESFAGMRTLVLGAANGFTAHVVALLRAQGCEVVHGQATSDPETPRPAHHVRPCEKSDHLALLDRARAGGPLSHVIHLWSLDPERPALESGFLSLMTLLQALDESDPARKDSILTLTVVADGLEDVTGSEPLRPERATLLGIAKVMMQEYPRWRCRVLDVVRPAPEAVAEAELARCILAEARSDADEFLVARRGPHRWARHYLPRPASSTTRQRLRRGGTYLVTGGMGGVGLALARYLSEAWDARLVLLGRTPLPPRPEWTSRAAAVDCPPAERHKLQQLMALQASGADFITVAADVTDPGLLQAALAEARSTQGPINGVIHAVLQPGHGLIAQRTPAEVAAALAPKVEGTNILLQATRQDPLDFVLLCSSVASVLGGLGRSDYAAANAYLDALAIASRRGDGPPLFAVNWDIWRDVGIARDLELPSGLGLDEASAVQAFERIVNGPDLPQTVVSTTPFAERVRSTGGALIDTLEAASASVQPSAPMSALQGRPPLRSPYEAPSSGLESALAGLWSDMLGITGLGARDNLFELGGDSLLAIRLLTRVRKAYGVEIHPAAFFKAPTISDLSLAIEGRLIDEIAHDDGASAP